MDVYMTFTTYDECFTLHRNHAFLPYKRVFLFVLASSDRLVCEHDELRSSPLNRKVHMYLLVVAELDQNVRPYGMIHIECR